MSSGQGYSQETRWLKLTSPLDENLLLPLTLTGRESISELFHYQLQLGSEELDITPTDIVGHPVTVELLPLAGGEGTGRYIHGIVQRFTAGNIADDKRIYTMQVVPKLWQLTRTQDSRIFQKETQTVADIIEEVLGEYEITKNVNLTATYPNLEYCVQYQESAFSFISRLMESAGIFYFFEHLEDDHKLHVVDDVTNLIDLAPDTLTVEGPGTGVNEGVSLWEHNYEFQPGKFTVTDYEFIEKFAGSEETPANNLLSEEASSLALENQDQFEVFEYPGGFQTATDGTAAAKVRLEQHEAQYHTVLAQSSYRGVQSGCKFTLSGHPAEDDSTFAIVSVEISADARHQYSGGAKSRPREFFQNTFRCIPDDVVFRPQRTTAKPRIIGTQTAVVVGGQDEEIHTDEHGRIQVQFFWDRVSTVGEPGQYWVRCAQSIAGKNWGLVFIPRVGQEVVVTFLEGDPDRPLVTGVVYNGEQPPPYALPDNKTQSGFKSMSSAEGDQATFNELRFEDKKDSEEIYFHAERDFNRVVENNDTLKVGFEKKTDGDQTIDICNNQVLNIGGDDASDGSQTLTIKKDRTTTIKEGDETLTVEKGSRSVTVTKGDDTHTIETGNRTVNVDTGDDTLTVKSGNLTIEVTAGSATVEAGQSIELKVGGNSITIDTSGITVTGTAVTVEGEASVSVTSPASEVNGDGSLTLSGGTINLN